jgi:hypothetical protein
VSFPLINACAKLDLAMLSEGELDVGILTIWNGPGFWLGGARCRWTMLSAFFPVSFACPSVGQRNGHAALMIFLISPNQSVY